MNFKWLRSVLLLALIGLIGVVFVSPAAFGQNNEIVASLQRVSGQVFVVQAITKARVQGRNGLLLRAGDEIITEANSRASIKFRTGSEVRLFPNTNFVVEAKEEKGKGRFFKFNLAVKIGSIWGNFVKRRQVANITTPTATIGIKGTTLRIVDRNGKARVALTEGLIDVSNDREKVELRPGKRITDFARNESIRDKIVDIPLRLDLKSEKRNLKFPNKRAEEVFVTVQLINIKSGNPVRRSGDLYLRSSYDKIEYPSRPSLDERGFARIPLKFMAPEAADAKFNGTIFVWAVMDQEDADDTSEGRLLFTIPVPAGGSKIRVDSRSGEAKKVQ